MVFAKNIFLLQSYIFIQGTLALVEGISLAGLTVDSIILEALSRMPQLRILILDGVKTDMTLSGVRLPRLAMLSWRDAGTPLLPFALEMVEEAAVVDISWNEELERLPNNLQACVALFHYSFMHV